MGWNLGGPSYEFHLFKEHHLEQVGEVEALVVWTEGDGKLLSLPREHEALNWDNTEYALAIIVLCACGRDRGYGQHYHSPPLSSDPFTSLLAQPLHNQSYPTPPQTPPSCPSMELPVELYIPVVPGSASVSSPTISVLCSWEVRNFGSCW